jgi:hypothetical protein
MADANSNARSGRGAKVIDEQLASPLPILGENHMQPALGRDTKFGRLLSRIVIEGRQPAAKRPTRKGLVSITRFLNRNHVHGQMRLI